MIKRTAILMTTAFMFVTLPGAAVADGQDQDRDQVRDRDHDCWDVSYSTDLSGSFILADGQDQDRDQVRDRDHDCWDVGYSTDSVNMILA